MLSTQNAVENADHLSLAAWLRLWSELGATAPERTLEAMHRQVLALYGDPARRFHTVDLLAARLRLADSLELFTGDGDSRTLASPPRPSGLVRRAGFRLALWMQDVIFDPATGDAALRAAKWAALALRDARVSDADTLAQVTGLIMATADVVHVDLDAALAGPSKSGGAGGRGPDTGGSVRSTGRREVAGVATPATGEVEAASIRDLTRALCWGLPEADYARYAQGIRAEWEVLDDEGFAAGRRAALEQALGWENAALTPVFEMPSFRDRYEARARENLARERKALGD